MRRARLLLLATALAALGACGSGGGRGDTAPARAEPGAAALGSCTRLVVSTDSTEARFEARYAEWRRYVQADTSMALSSRTSDYTDNEAYRRIVRLGTPALPFIMKKLPDDFLLNAAVFAIAQLRHEDISPREDYASEQEISKRLLAWWAARKR